MSYSSYNRSSGDASPWPWILGILGTVFVVWLLIFVISLLSARTTPQAGEIGVVRSGPSGVWIGSWFNGHNIKKVVPPGSGSSFTGLGSETHYYPSSSVQRTYTITSDASRGDRPGVDVVEVPTSDGVRVGLEGAFYFTTAFDGTSNGRGEQLAKDFDNRFGVRTFPVAGSDSELHPWEGTDGWSAFLDTVIRPIIDNDLRRSIAGVSCPQLVSSCALVHNNGNANASINNGGLNSQQIQQIQTDINNGLRQDVTNTLGVDYFSNIQFLLSKVTLPSAVQGQIDNAQAQFASVGAAQAEYQRNVQLAKAKEALNKAYQACSACATIDELSKLPSGLTTLVFGGGNSGPSIAVK